MIFLLIGPIVLLVALLLLARPLPGARRRRDAQRMALEQQQARERYEAMCARRAA